MSESMKFCRVCLVPEEDEEFKSLFDIKGNYAIKIELISGIQIAQPSKEIPQIICSNCIQDLDSADRLRLQLLDADEYFSVLVNDRVRKMEVEDFEQDQPLIKTEVVDHQSHSDEYFNHIVRAGLVKPEPETKKKATIKSIPKDYKLSSKAEVQIIKDSIKEEKLLVDDKKTQKNKKLLIPLVPKKVPKKSFDSKVNSSSKELMKESQEKAASAEKTTTVLSSKRHRKISSKLLESTEPAAKRIKRFHMSSMGGDDDKIKSTEKFPSKPPNDVKQLKAQTKISFECDTCSASFNSNLELNKHLNTHSANEAFKCFYCQLEFEQYSSRLMHMQTKHSEQLRKKYSSFTEATENPPPAKRIVKKA